MPVIVSHHLTDAECRQRASDLQKEWAALLKENEDGGWYSIGHGSDGDCPEAHQRAFDRGLWIFTTNKSGRQTRTCLTFLSEDDNPLPYVSANRVEVEALNKNWAGSCGCGGSHA